MRFQYTFAPGFVVHKFCVFGYFYYLFLAGIFGVRKIDIFVNAFNIIISAFLDFKNVVVFGSDAAKHFSAVIRLTDVCVCFISQKGIYLYELHGLKVKPAKI